MPRVPCSPYAASKWACTGYARMFHALYQLPVIIARPFMVYGPGQWDLTKLLPYVIVSLLNGDAPRVSSGDRTAGLGLRDGCRGWPAHRAKSQFVDARTIDLGPANLVSIRDIVTLVRELLGSQSKPVRRDARPPLRTAPRCAARRNQSPPRMDPVNSLEGRPQRNDRLVSVQRRNRGRHQPMIFTETGLAGALVVDVEPHADERGFFARSWCSREFAARGLNASRRPMQRVEETRCRGTLRGMHYQVRPIRRGQARSLHERRDI